ncbi:hypothetical protein IFM46972_03663 [Aspergillus udagawae]|uniref:Uncharacterized protein n=1 Tax=Aspergillus udagawae TaxID=91492 RepID=A0A8H3NEP2_9EURO|nr:hypothetical protein IFM46972_03663 [Aspergillus udagawae]
MVVRVYHRAGWKTDERGFDEEAVNLSGSGPNLAFAARYAGLWQDKTRQNERCQGFMTTNEHARVLTPGIT